MRRFVDQSTFTSDTDGCENVIASAHNCSDIGSLQFFYDRSRRRLEFVFEDDEAYELQVTLGLFSLHFLYFKPIDFDRLRSAGNDTET